MINLDVMKREFEGNELIKDGNINRLELQLNDLIQKIYEMDPELSDKVDDLCGEIASAYVNCCFKNGVRYGINFIS